MSHPSSSTSIPVVFYQYDSSPFGQKLDYVLTLAGVKHCKVDVPVAPPRTALADLLGIHYRRIPVLAIGRDVYVDTSLITAAISRRFPPSAGYAPLFPPRKGGGSPDTGLVKAFAMTYTDRTVFGLASTMMAWDRIPPAIVKDRSAFSGSQINPAAILARQPAVRSILSAHLALLEEQLGDGREWLFDTVAPGYADISVYFEHAWIRPFRATQGLYEPSRFPKTVAWLDRMSAFLKHRRDNTGALCEKITGEQGAKLVVSSAYETKDPEFDEADARVWGLSRGARVSVAPDDGGKNVPTFGTLVGFNLEELVIETSSSAGIVRCHFPRLFFTAVLASDKARL